MFRINEVNKKAQQLSQLAQQLQEQRQHGEPQSAPPVNTLYREEMNQRSRELAVLARGGTLDAIWRYIYLIIYIIIFILNIFFPNTYLRTIMETYCPQLSNKHIYLMILKLVKLLNLVDVVCTF